MTLEENKFHKSFQLNGKLFSSVDEILAYTNNFSNDIYCFLENWFSSDDCISVQTSGSTGLPKSILLKKEQMINSAHATATYFNVKENTKALLCLSVNYIAGKMMLIRALTLGWHLDVVVSDSNPLKDVNKQFDFVAMVPLQLGNSVNLLHKVKTVIVGGGIVSKELQTKLQNSICNVFATYGMTETITHIALKRLNNFNKKPTFYEVMNDVEIYKDQRNCLVIYAPKVSNEVVFTNDVVDLISDTQFKWLGRFDNIINSGGIKLQPEKIEGKLTKVIKERFFIAGISDFSLGEKLVLVIEGERKQIDFNKANLSKYEVPKEVFFIDEFIETETKKIQRKKTLDLIGF